MMGQHHYGTQALPIFDMQAAIATHMLSYSGSALPASVLPTAPPGAWGLGLNDSGSPVLSGSGHLPIAEADSPTGRGQTSHTEQAETDAARHTAEVEARAHRAALLSWDSSNAANLLDLAQRKCSLRYSVRTYTQRGQAATLSLPERQQPELPDGRGRPRSCPELEWLKVFHTDPSG